MIRDTRRLGVHRAGSRRETRVLIFDKWVARSRSTGPASSLTSARSLRRDRARVRLHDLSTESRGLAQEKGPFCLTSLTVGHGLAATRGNACAYRRARRFGLSLPRIPNPEAGRTRALGRRVAPSGAPALVNVGAFASGARLPTGSARDR